MLVASFSNPYDVYAGKTFLLPSQFTLDGYKAVFADANIPIGYLNSIKYTLIGTVFSVAMLYITAYPLAQKDLPGRKALSLFFIITMYFGGGLVPTYLVVKQTGLINNMWALFLPGGVGVGNMIIVRNYFQNSIPHELIEASEIDGCSKLRTFLGIVIPLSMPIMAVMVVFCMVAYWNDWFTALIYLTGAEKAPLPLVLRNVLIKSSFSASQASTISGGYAELNKVTGQSAMSPGYQDNEVLNKMQEETGISINWNTMSDSLSEQVNIHIAGGDLPAPPSPCPAALTSGAGARTSSTPASASPTGRTTSSMTWSYSPTAP